MPTAKPTMVAKMIPTTATSSVLPSPTSRARAYVDVGLYSMSVCEMSKPAVVPRNPKPEAMFWRLRLVIVLLTIIQSSAPSTSTIRIW